MSRTPSREQIEARAYEIFLERGSEHGHDLEHWIAAEKELSQRHAEIEAIYQQEKPEPVKVGQAATASGRRR
jgi:hypothetical protein